jgi:hypothetical protein
MPDIPELPDMPPDMPIMELLLPLSMEHILEFSFLPSNLFLTRNVLRFFISSRTVQFVSGFFLNFRCQFFLVQSLNCTFDGRNLENRKRYFLQD